MIRFREKILWFICCLICSSYVSTFAYLNTLTFVHLVDLLATILSVLTGMCLAIVAILSTPSELKNARIKSDDEKSRIEKILDLDDSKLLAGQIFIFWIYYAGLILSILFKYLSLDILNPTIPVRLTAALTFFIGTYAVLWSATLPSLLSKIYIQKRFFGRNS